MNRSDMLQRALAHPDAWDMVIVGGGATGMGVAVDAASRGYDVLLLEQSDFGKGTSSRSTKLIHGGVRYLQQGNLPLVVEALRERGILHQNAPHLVRDLLFVVPRYAWWEAPFYGLGLKMYDVFAGEYRLGRSALLSREKTLNYLPTVHSDGLRGGVLYHDSQFDDCRLLITLAQTAADYGAILLNYVQVVGFLKDQKDRINGVQACELETRQRLEFPAKLVINATGPFSDQLRRLADPRAEALIAPSQGVHLVFDRAVLPGKAAMMVPHTADGRVMFALPWQGHTLLGTTDTPTEESPLEPRALSEEIDLILKTASRYLSPPPTRGDIRSVFAGVRPLVRGPQTSKTALLARDHRVHLEASGMLTIAGGKWTTYRKMAEDCVNQAAVLARLPPVPAVTRDLRLHGFDSASERFGQFAAYGSDAPTLLALIEKDPELGRVLHPELPYSRAEALWGVRFEMARTVEDVLARRTRALFLNARAALECAGQVADLMARELKKPVDWQTHQIEAFRQLATNYVLENT